jgi:hypothetical protein
MKLKNICNFINYSKLKNSNKKDNDQMWRKDKLQGLVWIFEGVNAFEMKKEKEKKKW